MFSQKANKKLTFQKLYSIDLLLPNLILYELRLPTLKLNVLVVVAPG